MTPSAPTTHGEEPRVKRAGLNEENQALGEGDSRCSDEAGSPL